MTKKQNHEEKLIADIKEAFTEPTNNMQIFFNDDEDVVFEDIAGHQVGSQWVAIMAKDGATYIYPAADIKMMKAYTTTQE